MTEIEDNTLEVGLSYYTSVLEKLNPDLRAFIYSDDELKPAHCFLIFKGLPTGGFAFTKDDELVAVFSLEGNISTEEFNEVITQKAKKLGIKELKIFFFGTPKLTQMYSSMGFAVKPSYKFDKKLAPKNWNYDKFGTPNLVSATKRIK